MSATECACAAPLPMRRYGVLIATRCGRCKLRVRAVPNVLERPMSTSEANRDRYYANPWIERSRLPEFRNDHRGGCTCFACVMRRISPSFNH